MSALGRFITQIIWHFVQRLRFFHDSLAKSRQEDTLNIGNDTTKRLEVAGGEIKEMQKDIKPSINSDKTIEAIDKVRQELAAFGGKTIARMDKPKDVNYFPGHLP